MKKPFTPTRTRYRVPLNWLIPFCVSGVLGMAASFYLLRPTETENISAFLIETGLDPQRALLIAALLMTCVAALLGSLLARSLWGALTGALIGFWFDYLQPFCQHAQQPVYDPGGRLEILNMTALVHTALIMLALALLAAFSGGAIGRAINDTLLLPLWHLGRILIKRIRSVPVTTVREAASTVTPAPHPLNTTLNVLRYWFQAGLLILTFLLVTRAQNLFLYAPDLGIHVPNTLAGAPGIPTSGSVVEDSLISPNGKKHTFLIYLPPSYNTPQARTRHYPSLYLLHGSPGSQKDWFAAGKADQSANELISLRKIPEMILVVPDGNGQPGVSSEWADTAKGQQMLATFVAHDLVHYVDAKYRTMNTVASRSIGGLSMGGFGAANIGIHHPDVFSAIISLGGYYKAEGGIWHNDAQLMAYNSPQLYLPEHKNAWNSHFYLGAATMDKPYYGDTQAFARELLKYHINYTLDIQKGYHAWNIWQTQLYHALIWLHQQAITSTNTVQTP